MLSKRSVVACSIPVILGLLGWANISLAQGQKPEPKPEPKKMEPPQKAEPTGEKDVAEMLKETPDLRQFDRLFTASGVASELKTGEWTIFAPDNAALAKKGNLWERNLLKPENKSELKKFIEGYIVKGKLTTADLHKEKTPLKTIGGETLTIALKDGKLTVNGAEVVKTEIMAKNGVIHRIDQVLEEKGAAPEPAPKPAAKPTPKPKHP
jgi:uncharacterized surface protein with fasciclin (FAS1) repeats